MKSKTLEKISNAIYYATVAFVIIAGLAYIIYLVGFLTGIFN
jgi:hypothetical protein